MRMELDREQNTAVVFLENRLDASTAPEFKNFINDLTKKQYINLVVDLANVQFIDSSGLGVLVTALRSVSQQGGDIKISGPTPEVQSLFSLTRLDKVFDIVGDVRTALGHFHHVA